MLSQCLNGAAGGRDRTLDRRVSKSSLHRVLLQLKLSDCVPQLDVLLHEPCAALGVLDEVVVKFAHALEDELLVLARDGLADGVASLLRFQMPAEDLALVLRFKQSLLKATALLDLGLQLLLDYLASVELLAHTREADLKLVLLVHEALC